MIAAAAGLGVLVGLLLGSLGGGGGVVTVPALVYVLGESAQQATTASLFIVGVTALVGVAGHAREHQVRWRTGLVMGALGGAASIPASLLNQRLDPDILLIAFAALILVAAYAMLRSTRGGADDEQGHGEPRLPLAALAAVVIGALTGLFGVGGGFLVVPALTLALGLGMPEAVGTSLLVVAINSLISVLSRTGHLSLDWASVVPFTIAAVLASLLGQLGADHLKGVTLRRGFAILLVVLAVFIATESAIKLA